MAAPLLALAALWERLDHGSRRWLRGREVSLGPLRAHTTNLFSGLMFVALGAVFIAYEGTSALSGLYVTLGTEDLAYAAESALSAVPTWASWGLTALVAASILVLVLRGRGRKAAGDNTSTRISPPEEKTKE